MPWHGASWGFVSPAVDSTIFIICTICMHASSDAHNTQLAVNRAGCSLGSKHNTSACDTQSLQLLIRQFGVIERAGEQTWGV